jgi:hypothetical protein
MLLSTRWTDVAINSSDVDLFLRQSIAMAVSVGTSARLAQCKVTADGNDLFTRVWVQPSLESRERLENRRTKPIVGSSHFVGMELSFRAGIRRQYRKGITKVGCNSLGVCP